jgi:malate/lactate dehydrogenase
MKVSIVGAAGVVGSCAAFAIADQGLAQEIVMIDTKQNIVINHAMDIHAAVSGQQDTLVRVGNYDDMTGSNVVIITAGIHFPASAPVREKLGPNIPIVTGIAKNIERFCPDAVVITATNPVDLLNYAIHLSTSLDRKKLIGYNLNDSIRFRIAAAKALGVKPTRVQAIVIGEHPRAPILLFSSIKVDGNPVAINVATKQGIEEELKSYLSSFEALNAGRSAGWTSASGLSTIIRAIGENAKRVLPCSAVLEGEYGYKSISMGIPVVIGKEGILQVLEWELSGAERQELGKVAQTLESSSAIVREAIGSNRR